MNNLLKQIMRFGIVGVICFILDYAVYRICNSFFEISGIAKEITHYIYLSTAISFTLSVIANYILSMKYVFVRKDDISRKKEFSIFVILSIGGLFVNELCMYIGLDIIYKHLKFVQNIMSRDFAKDVFFKFAATGVVMVYNFISRKIFLEKKEAS